MQMPSASPLPRLMLAAAGVYTAQSLVGGLTFLGVPAVLRAESVSLDRIGLVSLAMLVWSLKFLWAAPVERWRLGTDGKRRSRTIIISGQILVALALVAFGLAGKDDFSLLLILLVLMAFASATVDIACDGFLIEQFAQTQKGLANIAQVGGGYLGMIFGSGLFVLTYAAYGWQAASLLLAGLVLLFAIPMMMTREAATGLSNPGLPPTLLKGLLRREIRIGILMAVSFELGGRLAQALAGPFLVDAGVPLSTLGLLNGTGGVLAGLIGTGLGGLIAHRLGGPRAMMAIGILHALSLIALAATVSLAPADTSWLIGLFVFEGAVMAAGFVTSYARLMQLVSPTQPGVDFTLFQCASACAAAICGISSPLLASRVGYLATFSTAAWLAVCVPPLLLLFEYSLTKRVVR